MIVVISPAKTLDFDTPPMAEVYSKPNYLNDSKQLVDDLRQLSPPDISKLMGVSAKLADLNYERYANWRTPFTPDNAKQAALAFKGDVYTGLNVEDFSGQDFEFAQEHLRILSGLYGLLRPLDLIQPYRLEMGTKLATGRGETLYQFWGTKITQGINEELRKLKSDILVNLASNEYFKAIVPQKLNAQIITPAFKEKRGDTYKIIGLLAKRARGMMSRFIIKNRITNPEDIKTFREDKYRFNKSLSTDVEWVFIR